MAKYQSPDDFTPQERAQEFFQQFGGRTILGAILLVLLVIGVFTSFFTVQPEGEAVVKRFGRVIGTPRQPGLHFKLPYGIDQAFFVPTRRVLKEEFGFTTTRTGSPSRGRSNYQKTAADRTVSLMLTGDLNVIDVEWVVQYRINDPDAWLHHVKDRVATIRATSEAVMRRIVGNRLGAEVLTTGRVEIANDAREQLQGILDSYDMGVTVDAVELQSIAPPEPVIPAYEEVNQAQQEKERLINEAERYRNRVEPRARGEAARQVADAEAYRADRVNTAQGQAERFTAVRKAYEEAPDVTRRRMYLETVDEVVPKIGRLYVMEPGEQSSPLPLLNLDQAGAASRGTGRKGGGQ